MHVCPPIQTYIENIYIDEITKKYAGNPFLFLINNVLRLFLSRVFFSSLILVIISLILSKICCFPKFSQLQKKVWIVFSDVIGFQHSHCSQRANKVRGDYKWIVGTHSYDVFISTKGSPFKTMDLGTGEIQLLVANICVLLAGSGEQVIERH